MSHDQKKRQQSTKSIVDISAAIYVGRVRCRGSGERCNGIYEFIHPKVGAIALKSRVAEATPPRPREHTRNSIKKMVSSAI